MLLFSQYSDISVLYVFHFSYKENLCLFHCWIICKCVFNFAISRPDIFWTIKTRPHHSCKLPNHLLCLITVTFFSKQHIGTDSYGGLYWDLHSASVLQVLLRSGAKNLAWFLSDASQTNVHCRAQWRFTTTTKKVWGKKKTFSFSA